MSRTRLSVVPCVIMMWSYAVGQSTVLQPVTVQMGRAVVHVGCDTAQVLDRSNLVGLTNEVQTQEQIMAELISSMQPSGGSKEDVKVIRKEQKLWMKARDQYCDDEVNDLPTGQKEVAQMSCREWAGRCRLEELLGAYDRVVPAMK